MKQRSKTLLLITLVIVLIATMTLALSGCAWGLVKNIRNSDRNGPIVFNKGDTVIPFGLFYEAEFVTGEIRDLRLKNSMVSDLDTSEPGNFFFTVKVGEATCTIPYKVAGELFTVTFDSNGGSLVEDLIYEQGQSYAMPEAPTRLGYDFAGWFYDNETFENEFTATEILSEDVTIYAKWNLLTYDIAYELSGGTNNPDNSATYSVESNVTFAAPIMEGYTFDGWFTFPEGIAITSTEGLTGDITVFAKWSPTEYVITYELNGGTNAIENLDEYTVETNVTFAAPTKTDYTFGGWFTDSEFAEGSAITSTEGLTGNITVYAKWTATGYAITYELNGGTNAEANGETYTVENNVTFADPTRSGYTFDGWFTFPEGIAITSTEGLTGDITVFAKWNANTYSITYNYEPAIITLPLSYTTEFTIETATFDLAEPASVADGFTFDGWYSINDEDYANRITRIPLGSWGDMVFTAKITAIEYTITYNYPEGAVNNTNNPATYTVVTPTITFANAAKTNYDFDGWFTDPNFLEATQITEIAAGSIGNVTLYAKFTPIVFSIAYELDGGTNDEGNPATYTVESSTITLADASKDYYDFGGWFTDSDFSEETEVTEIATGSSGNVTLYAKFTPTVYDITYELDGGTNAEANIDTFDVENNLTFQPATKIGCSFLGWFEDPSFETPITSTSGKYAPITVYAQWGIATYLITYELDGGTNDAGNPTTYRYIDDTITLADASKDYYEFLGWFTTSTFEEGSNITAITAGSTGNVTLYAKFEAYEYTVNYYLDSVKIDSKVYTINDSQEPPITAERPYYINNGFQFVVFAIDGSVLEYDVSAVYTPIRYTIVIDLNGGSWTSALTPPSYYTYEDDTIRLSNYTAEREGYTFDGWYDGENADGTFDGHTRIDGIIPANSNGNRHYYAKWTPITYSITFETGTGEWALGYELPTSYSTDSTVILPTAEYITNSGLIFLGWFDNASCTGSPIMEIPAGSIGNKVFYAGWGA